MVQVRAVQPINTDGSINLDGWIMCWGWTRHSTVRR